MRILCTGDLHLGRRPSRLPASLDDQPQVAVASVWQQTVRHAIDQQIDLCVLTGDLIDRANRLFEAWGPLERGLTQLNDAAIPTVMVAGNHDFDLLGPFIDSLNLPNLHLLGRDGHWQTLTLDINNQPVQILGISFAHQHMQANPLDALGPLSPAPGLRLGVLHADLDQPDSDYAPVTTQQLQALPVDAWLLGHIHQPTWHAPASAAPAILYPGSLQPLDPGEPGIHGPWLIDLSPGKPPTAQQWPLASVRYQRIDVSLEGISEPGDLAAELPRQIRQQLDTHDQPTLQCLACRLNLTGATPLHSKLDALIDHAREQLELMADDTLITVEHIQRNTRPTLDLHELSRQQHGVGELAAMLLALQSDPPDASQQSLIEQTRQAIDRTARSSAYRALDPAVEPTAEQARAQLVQQGLALLEELLAQKEAPA